MSEREEPSIEERSPDPAAASRSRARLLWLGVAAAGLVALGSLLWWNWPATDVETVTVLGVEYSTNLRLDEHDGYTYVYVPVNTDVGTAVLQVEDAGDRAQIRAFLDSLDTLLPGEHVLALSDANLHFIVDGMDE